MLLELCNRTFDWFWVAQLHFLEDLWCDRAPLRCLDKGGGTIKLEQVLQGGGNCGPQFFRNFRNFPQFLRKFYAIHAAIQWLPSTYVYGQIYLALAIGA